MPKNPTLTPTLRRDMVDIVSQGTHAYLTEFTRDLFPDFRAANVQALIADGIADAIRRYEATTGVPLTQTLALTLLDKENPQ